MDFEKFATQLRTEQGAPLCIEFQTFLSQFSQISALSEQRKHVSNFLKIITAKSTVLDLDQENIAEGWEKLLMSRIFDQVFYNNQEQRANQMLSKKISTFGWLEERHLDIPFNYSLRLEAASAELLKLNGYKAPRDKLVIIQNVLNLIADLITTCSESKTANQDLLLPTLILTIIRANPPNMISNIKYITRFRSPVDLESGKSQFCMTTMMSAISFIYNMTIESITLDEQDKLKLGLNQKTKTRQPQTELGKITNNVSEFFTGIFKEVRSLGAQAADELAANLSPSTTSSLKSSSQSPITEHNSKNNLNDLYQQEEFELQLAMALSLSTQEDTEKSAMNQK